MNSKSECNVDAQNESPGGQPMDLEKPDWDCMQNLLDKISYNIESLGHSLPLSY